MLCDVCKKNEATIHIKEVHNGKVVASNLCGECAREKEAKGEFGTLGFNLAEVLFNLGKLSASMGQADSQQEETRGEELPACPVCGWTVGKVRESGGRLGCPECYRTFEPMISEALGRFQRGTIHLGKRPKSAGQGCASTLRFELERRRRELEELIRREEYEEAAVCRDRINQLKKELEKCDHPAPPAAEPEKETGDGSAD